jgi:tetratricopeptide (TPR) repeat protein
MHHYCSGIHAEQKAKNILNKGERAYWLGRVVHQRSYVSGSCNTGHVLYPELHTRWGWALSEQGQTAEAMQHYQLAIQAKRNYTLAYARLSELYLEVKQPDEARKVLESGLKASPNSRMLKKRLNKLDSSD